MSDIFAKMIVAADSRRNPAAGLFYRAASDFGRLLGDACSGLFSLCESSSSPISYPEPIRYAKPSPSPLHYATMSHRSVPDYTRCIRDDVARLCGEYRAQEKVINETRERIESHERIDLRQLDSEIKQLQNEIDRCQSSEKSIIELRGQYRAEGMVRNVFVHGLRQCFLSRKVRKLREEKTTLMARQDALKSLADMRNAFDFSAERHLLNMQEEELSTILQRWRGQVAKFDSFSLQMRSFVDRIVDTTRRLNCQIDKYNTLSRYEAELNAASGAYGRRLVHKKCEAEFGSGSVGRLQNRVVAHIRSLSSLYDKQVCQAERHARAIGLLA